MHEVDLSVESTLLSRLNSSQHEHENTLKLEHALKRELELWLALELDGTLMGIGQVRYGQG